MEVTFVNFLEQLVNYPILIIITLLISGVVFVNGWIDAPNAIATCVSTRSIRPKRALAMASIFNFLGVFIMSMFSSTVAKTIYNIADFNVGETKLALETLCGGLIAIVLWATFAWKFGLPTSQSHALIAGISGAAIALHKGFNGINFAEWKKVLIGLAVSVLFGFLTGFLFTKIIEKICKNMDRRRTIPVFKKTQVFSGAAMAFMHGAQDGQKFIGIFLMGIFLVNGVSGVQDFYIPIWLMILCSAVMTLGTCIGGYKVIKTIGSKIVKMEPYQGTAADFAGAFCLLIFSLLGIPVSTSHTKITAIMGVGAAKRLSAVNWSVVKNMVLAWVLTFPGAGILGGFVTMVLMKIF